VTRTEGKTVAAAALLLSGAVLLSRLLGYAREMVLAWRFGAGPTTDAFYAAFQIPDLLNYFLAGGALSIAFIPLYNKALAKDGAAGAGRLASVVCGTIGLAAVIATAWLWYGAEALVRLQFPAFAPETATLATHLTRIVLPAQIFFIVGGIVQGVLLARRDFRAAALAPLIYNGAIIAGGLLSPSIDGFAWGTLAGAVLGPFLIPAIQAVRLGVLPLPVVAPLDKHFKTYILLAAPLMLGQTLLTLDEWYGRWFGAALGEGAVSHLGYARRLMLVPVAVIGQAAAAAALPSLSALWAEDKKEEMNALLEKTLRTALLLSVIAGAGLCAVAPAVVKLVYEQGKFLPADTAVVGGLLAILALAIPGWVAQQVAVRGFYARGDTWRPMVLGTAVSVLVIPVYIVLAERMGVYGIGFAGVIGMTASVAGTFAVSRRLHGTGWGGVLADMLRHALIAAVAGAAAAFVVRLEFWGPGKIDTVLALAASGAAFLAVLLPGLFLFGGEGVRAVFRKYTPNDCRRK
jgi:putative peptidoglycan lipid II flippase